MKSAALLAGMAALLLAGCASRPAAPAPVPAPQPPPPPPTETPPPPPAPETPQWEDQPLTTGDWRYEEAAGAVEARYGEGGAAIFTLRCDRQQRRIAIGRADAAGAPLTIRTTFASRTLGPGDGAALPATDAFLDAIVFSRGRFSVEAPGVATLIVPTWPEPARVIEECR